MTLELKKPAVAAALIAIMCGPWAASAKQVDTKDELVNCDLGETIAGGLAKSTSLVVSGTCVEDISISADDVTLLADPVAGATIQGAVDIVGAARVSITGFTISSPETWTAMLVRDGATAFLSDVTIQPEGAANISNGIAAYRNATVIFRGGTVTGAANNGMYVYGSSFLHVREGSEIHGNGDRGVLVSLNSGLRVDDSTIYGHAREEVSVGGASAASLTGNTITADRYGVHVAEGSSARLDGNTITADHRGVRVAEGGSARLDGNTITAGQSALVVERGGNVSLEGGNDLSVTGTDETLLVTSARLDQHGNSGMDVIDGDVFIGDSADAQFRDIELTGNLAVHLNSLLILRNRSGAVGKTVMTGNIVVSKDSTAHFRRNASLGDDVFAVNGSLSCLDLESSTSGVGGIGAVASFTGGVACTGY